MQNGVPSVGPAGLLELVSILFGFTWIMLVAYAAALRRLDAAMRQLDEFGVPMDRVGASAVPWAAGMWRGWARWLAALTAGANRRLEC